MKQQQELTQRRNAADSTIQTLEKEIAALNDKIKTDQESADEIARSVQVSAPARTMLNMILSSQSISDFIERIVAINMINESAHQQLAQLRQAKSDKANALEEKKSAIVQMDQDDQKLKESLAIAVPSGSFTPANSEYTNLDISEDQARANIVARESSGNYEAVNGIMYGAYQMANMPPGTPPAEQDALAQAYINERYQGSWVVAWNFWIEHHWY
ncbi:MAG: hypothetical protein LBV19_08860 [Streptococcaceae bacterium]|nr:hypothetical protein [Streptococcaceae bacterium]